MILAGEVLVDEQKADKPGRQVATDATVRLVRQRSQFVSRAGAKLDAAIRHYGIVLQNSVCLDIGASTGGFTDCLLQYGAQRVHAVDVGIGQLHWKVRQDPRVVVHERLNARYLRTEDIGDTVDFVTCDVSFISATKILPRLGRVLQKGGQAVVLAKPQFEVGKSEVGKGGIVRDEALHRVVIEKVRMCMTGSGFETVRWIESPITGMSGNREFLLYGIDWSPRRSWEADS